MAAQAMETHAGRTAVRALRDFSRIAIVQTAFIGDVALVFNLVQTVRTVHPHAAITLVTTPAGAALASCVPAVDTVIAYDKRGDQRGWRGIASLAEELHPHADCLLAPHRSLRTTLLAWFARPRYSVGFDRNALSFLYSRRVRYPFHLHEVERNLALLSPFADVARDSLLHPPAPVIRIPEKVEQRVDMLLEEAGIRDNKQLVVLAPGSIWPTKRWPEEHMVSAARSLVVSGWNVVLSGSRDDEALCSRIAVQSGGISLAGKTGLPETLALLQRADILLGNDSAPTHLANLVHCPVITIFGPTSPMFGFAPRGVNDRVIQQDGLACRPCSIHGQKECPLGTFACMNEISSDRVVREIGEVMQHIGKTI